MMKNFKTLDDINLQILWSTITTSTILFLKLFDDKYTNIKARNSNLLYPITYLSFEYGLLNCYLSESHNRLYLIFDRKRCIDDKNLTSTSYYNFIDVLINHQSFISIQNHHNLVIVGLKISSKWLPDIDIIVSSSKYSTVSDEFKKQMNIPYKEVPMIENQIARYLVTKNIAFGIVSKYNFLKNTLLEELKTDESWLGSEFYVLFDKQKEYFNLSHLEKYITK